MYFILLDSIRSDKDKDMIMCARAMCVCVPRPDYEENTFQFDGKCIFNDFANTRNEFSCMSCFYVTRITVFIAKKGASDGESAWNSTPRQL